MRILIARTDRRDRVANDGQGNVVLHEHPRFTTVVFLNTMALGAGCARRVDGADEQGGSAGARAGQQLTPGEIG